MKTIKYISLALVLLGVQAMFGATTPIMAPGCVGPMRGNYGCYSGFTDGCICKPCTYTFTCNDGTSKSFIVLREFDGSSGCNVLSITDASGNVIIEKLSSPDFGRAWGEALLAARIICKE